MIARLHHPLWTHLPGLVLVVAIYVVVLGHAVPDHVPLQFDASGEPVRWGSRVEFWIFALGWPLVILAGSAFLDEINARQEPERRFNWLAVLDELVLGVLLGMVLKLTPALSSPQPVFTFPWLWMIGLGSGAALLAVLLERLRPHRPAVQPPEMHFEHSAAEQDQIARAPDTWMYWEVQNPLYLQILIPVTAGILIAGTVLVLPVMWPLSVLPAFGAALILLLYGGMRVTVTPRHLVLRFGVLGIRLRQINLADVEHIEPVSFSPLADFGGWGLRYSFRLKAWAFFLQGRRGVMYQTSNGSKTIIGSDTPERLAAFSQTALRLAQA
jgi:hypothetical protein